MMFILMKLAAIGIVGWLLTQMLTLKYAWTRELADLDWTVLGQPGNLLALGLVARMATNLLRLILTRTEARDAADNATVSASSHFATGQAAGTVEGVMMLWDDVTTAWGRLTIIQAETSWAICAEAEWPDGNQSSEALFNLTLAGVIDAIGKRGPYVGQVVWRTPPEWKAGE